MIYQPLLDTQAEDSSQMTVYPTSKLHLPETLSNFKTMSMPFTNGNRLGWCSSILWRVKAYVSPANRNLSLPLNYIIHERDLGESQICLVSGTQCRQQAQLEHPFHVYAVEKAKGRLQNPTAGWPAVPPGFYCSEQWQPPGTGRNRRSTGGWVLKPPLTQLLISLDPEDLCETHPWILICCLGSTSKKPKKKPKKKKKKSTPVVVVPGSSGIYERKANVKVHSYYTAIALRCRYINYFLPQVTAASPHFKLKWI